MPVSEIFLDVFLLVLYDKGKHYGGGVMKYRIILSLIGIMLLFTLLIFGGRKFIEWLFDYIDGFIDSWLERKRHAGKHKKKKGNRNKTVKKKKTHLDKWFDEREKRQWGEVVLSYIMLWFIVIGLIIYVAINVP